MTTAIRTGLATALFLLPLANLRGDEAPAAEQPVADQQPPGEAPEGMVWIPGGWFTMGDESFPDAQPLHRVYVDGFWMDTHEVTKTEAAEEALSTL